ncbi:MAG: sugar ABC transporter permease [Clostridiales bacterium]|jgi:arabinosaccharide transport system permease protein|nr:sugar ABC transporter permease [Clostridiales bacterium]
MTGKASGRTAHAQRGLAQFLNSKNVVPYIFAAPFIVFFLIFFLYPILYTGQMSLFSQRGFAPPQFSGFFNYQQLNNDYFLTACKISAQYTLLTCLILIPVPLVLANMLNSGSVKQAGVMKSALFIPALTSVVMAGLFFRYAFSANQDAIFNAVMRFLGLPPQDWLAQQGTTMFVLVVFCCWKWMGVNVVYYYSALQSIPADLFESARIDGANAFKQFIHITIPSVRQTIIYVLTISIYGGFSMFAESFTLFNSARTPGDIGATVVSYIYSQGFNRNNFGLASAAGIVLLLIVLIINIIQLYFTKSFSKEV